MMLMQHLPVLPILLPLLAGAIMIIGPIARRLPLQRVFGCLMSFILLAAACTLLWQVEQHGTIAYAVGEWQPPFGILLVADRLAAIMVVMSSFLLLCVQLYSCAGEDTRGRFMHPLLMFQVLGINGSFITGDIFNLFVFFEILLISSYALVIHGGGKHKTQSDLHYVILNLAGSSLFLFGLGLIYATFGTLNMADMQVKVTQISAENLLLAEVGAMLLMVVFALKSAMLPLQFWLPRLYSAAPAPIAALFAILTKVGIYSLWRVHGVIFGDNAGELANIVQPWIWPLGWLTLAVGSVMMMASRTLRYLTANLVIVSVGSLLLMVAINTPEAVMAGSYYLIHSTITCAFMFLLAGLIIDQRGKAEDRFVRARSVSQSGLLSALFFVGALALIGMPPLSGFIGKALMLNVALHDGSAGWIWPVMLLGSLVAIIMLSRAGSTIFWRARGRSDRTLSVHPAQLIAVLLLLCALVLMVVYAGWLTNYLQQAAQDMYQGINLDELRIKTRPALGAVE